MVQMATPTLQNGPEANHPTPGVLKSRKWTYTVSRRPVKAFDFPTSVWSVNVSLIGAFLTDDAELCPPSRVDFIAYAYQASTCRDMTADDPVQSGCRRIRLHFKAIRNHLLDRPASDQTDPMAIAAKER